MFLNYIKRIWELLNKISPNNRNLIIILLMGYIFYSQINESTRELIVNRIENNISSEKKAELYTKSTAVEINRQVRLIADKDQNAFDVLLLSYHNSTQSLQGYKYLYLSCLVEAPRTLDTPLLKKLWNEIDYIYYADELSKIHELSFVQFKDVENMKTSLPKLYHLVKASDAKSISFFTIEGKYEPLGLVVILYNEFISYDPKNILPSLLKLAVLLDYENVK